MPKHDPHCEVEDVFYAVRAVCGVIGAVLLAVVIFAYVMGNWVAPETERAFWNWVWCHTSSTYAETGNCQK